jgi:hypothetical protein
MKSVRRRAIIYSVLALLGLSVFAAKASPITYDVNFSDGTNSVTGTITTVGNFGALSSSDITAWDLVIHAGPDAGISKGANPPMLGIPLLASSSVIDFEPALGSASFINGPVDWQLLSSSLSPPFGAIVYTTLFRTNTVPFLSPFDRDIPIAVAELTPPDTTPLPAALPLFASGLGALGLLGWRRKQKQRAFRFGGRKYFSGECLNGEDAV